jgi:hypothetical protein
LVPVEVAHGGTQPERLVGGRSGWEIRQSPPLIARWPQPAGRPVDHPDSVGVADGQIGEAIPVEVSVPRAGPPTLGWRLSRGWYDLDARRDNPGQRDNGCGNGQQSAAYACAPDRHSPQSVRPDYQVHKKGLPKPT